MRIIVIVSLLLMSSFAWCLQYEAGSGMDVSRIDRDNDALYHTGEDDRHFYYTYPESEDHLWAVKYDFRSYFNNVDSLTFTPSSVWIYLPNETEFNELNAALYSDGYFGPGEEITSAGLTAENLISGWNEIELSAAADTLFWLVVNYPTGLGTEQYISASNGDGSHSYYWDPYYGDEGSWLSMSANGFANEFLFTLSGQFNFTGIDLEISNMYLEGNFAAGEEVTLNTILHNNSSVTVDSLSVVIKKEYPGDTQRDTLYVYDVPAGADIDLTEINEMNYILSDYPGQYKFSANLYCENDAVLANNSKVINRNTFSYTQPEIMIENMVELNDNYTEGIWSTQDQFNDYNLKVISYFPNYQDGDYYNSLAEERFHYYELYNLPATVISGNPVIGYDPNNYTARLLEKCEEIDSLHSFVEITNIEALVDTLEDVHVTVTLNKGDNVILSTLAANCSIFGMIYEEGLPLNDQLDGIVFLDTLEFASETLDALANTVSVEKTTVFNQLYKFTPISGDMDNCKIFFWVQNTEDNMIWASGSLSFSEFGIVDASEDEISPVNGYVAYPNPFSPDKPVQLKIPGAVRSSSIQINIYNIKGQIVRNLPSGELSWDGYDNNRHLSGNGIYFMQINQSENHDWLKVMILK